MGSQGLIVKIEGDGLAISFDDNGFTDGPGWDRVKVVVETNSEVGVDLKREGFPAVGGKLR